MTTLLNIFEVLQSYLQDHFTDVEYRAPGGSLETMTVPIQMAYFDERFDSEESRSYPAATLMLFDAGIGSDRRFGGYTQTITTDEQAGTAEITPVPIPVDLFFQLDTYCQYRGQDWALLEKMLQVLGARKYLTLGDGSKLRLITRTTEALDGFAEPGIIRKSYRFLTPAWFNHPDGSRTEPLITTLNLTMYEVRWSFSEAA